MKYIIPPIVWVNCFFIYWLSDNEFQRGFPLAMTWVWASAFSIGAFLIIGEIEKERNRK